MSHPFSGSYDPNDVTFLLKRVTLAPTSVAAKERAIQGGARHYSEMIGEEHDSSPSYTAAFEAALARNGPRLARDVLALSAAIDASHDGPIQLVSLARAGTPVGVLLLRTLEQIFGRVTEHASVSIIRDRGIDAVALRHLLKTSRARPANFVFVDGWTGKGVIARELARSLANFDVSSGVALSPRLHVIADVCGAAAVSATDDDYLVPSSLLGATVSGLISRSILNAELIGPNDFHGCVHYTDLAPYDLSRRFVDVVHALVLDAARIEVRPPLVFGEASADRWIRARAAISDAMARYGASNENLVKPGIGEATRVLLRRVPEVLIVRQEHDSDVVHALILAEEKGVPVVVDPTLPFRAMAVIRSERGAGPRSGADS